MIARDEQAMLPGCLESVRGEVDEIILVDTGSGDQTPDLARALGAVVESFPWTDDFAAARNHSLRYATGDWILVLDCDERLDPSGRGRIRGAVAAARQDAFLLRLRSATERGPTGEQWYALRLYRQRAGVRYQGRIHEQLRYPVALPGLAPVSGAAILHLGYQGALIETRDKHLRNQRLVELALADCPPEKDPVGHSFYLFYSALGATGRERAARIERWVSFVGEHPELEQHPIPPWIPAGLARYAWWLSDAGSHGAAEQRAAGLLERHGESPIVRLCLARARAASGDVLAAEKQLGLLLDRPRPPADAYLHFPLDLGLIRRRGWRVRGEIRERQGRLEEAERCYRRAVEGEPGHLPALLRLVCVLVQRGRWEPALQAMESSPALAAQGLPEFDCLGLALSLIAGSPDQVLRWRDKVHHRAARSPLAARVWDQAAQHRPDAPFRLADFPDLERGVRLGPL